MTKLLSQFCDLWLKNTENNPLTIFLKSKIQKQIGMIDNQISTTKPMIANHADTLDEQPFNSNEKERMKYWERG